MGVFDRIFAALAAEGAARDCLTIDSPHLKMHRTAASLLTKEKRAWYLSSRAIPKGGLNS